MARKKQTFDEAMERLEEIVEQLEQEEVRCIKRGCLLRHFAEKSFLRRREKSFCSERKQGFGRRSRFRRRWKNDGFEAGNEGTLCLY